MTEAPPPLPSAEQLFDEVPCGLLVTSHTGTILKINRTMCDWIGYPAQELVGLKKFSDLVTMGGRIFHQTHWEPMLQMQGSVSEVKFDVRHKSGRTIPMMVNAIRRLRDGVGYDEVSLTVADERNKYERELLAARKRADELVLLEREAQAVLRVAQARVSQALTAGALFIWGVDASTGKRHYGDEVARLLGHDDPRPVAESDVLLAIPAHEREAEAAMLAEALSSRTPFYWKYRLVGVDGQTRVIAASGRAFVGEGGSFSHFVGMLQDITAMERLRAAAEDRALFAEQMIGIVSHDLRNPLSAILIGTQILSAGMPLPDDKRAKLLGNVASSAQRAQRLISDLLDFTVTRVGSGISVARQALDLHAFTGQIVDELRLAFPGRKLEHRVVGEGPCQGASDRLAQVIGNLVGNAIVYGTAEGAVTITSVLQDEFAMISVHNFGEPIAPANLSSLFEPMVRGDNVDTTVRSVGLGLFIVKAIADAHRGKVLVTSSADEGTTFLFEFPRV